MKTNLFFRAFLDYKFLIMTGVLAVSISACTSPSSAPEQDSSVNRPSGGSVSSIPEGTPGTHTVKPGETLYMIARQYSVSPSSLIAWNGLANPNQISVGQVLRVSAASATSDTGVETRPVGNSAPETVHTKPVIVAGGAGAAGAVSADVTKGGKTPYSDEAWQQQKSGAVASTPASSATPAKAPETNVQSGGSGEWAWPVTGKVVSGFSETANMKGLDIAANAGTPVLAARAGKVAYAGSGLRGYGKLVIVSHEGDYLSAYAHNRTLLVKEGDVVKQGQKIAEVGDTDTDRTKLHFEIRKQGRPVDPAKYLSAQ